MARKILLSFFISALLCAGIAVLASTGALIILVAIFLTLFLTIFFCFNLRPDSWSRDSADKMWAFVGAPDIKSADLNFDEKKENEELEELETAEDAPSTDVEPERKVLPDGPAGIPRRVNESEHRFKEARFPSGNPNVQVAFGDDDIPYLVESSGLELIEGDIDEVIRFMEDAAVAELGELETASSFSSAPPVSDNKNNDDAVELEDIFTESGGGISILRQPFGFSPDNPELLQNVNEVLYEKNGIHYISSNVFDGDKNTVKELNEDFAKLVESVVNKA